MSECKCIETARAFTQAKLSTLRLQLEEALAKSPYQDKLTIVATGSYGREEASRESDLDLFVLLDADLPVEEAVPDELRQVAGIVEAEVPNSVGDTGTFGSDVIVQFADMLRNIGGENDSNASLTRRMLFLLEGTWLYGEQRFREQQAHLLEKYLPPSTPVARVPMFLLNDIIRYYRTVTTDFEHKVTQAGKSWGLRNIKLRFSRKLLYFGGIVVAAELADLDASHRVRKARALFSLPVLRRIQDVGGIEAAKPILEIYEQFLARISNPACRQALDAVSRENRHGSDAYQELRGLADEFSLTLASWLKTRHPEGHPVHHALIF